MPEATGNGLTIYFETEGDPHGEPLLVIMGLGAQMTSWRPEFRAALVRRGFFVISFDNRDAGRSTWFDDAGPADLSGAFAGTATPPYLLTDMAADAVSVLDAAGLPTAHVLGASMGGMIAQCIAIGHTERVRTLTSIMSTTGDPSVGRPRPDIAAMINQPAAIDRAGAIEQGLSGARAVSSPGFPFDEEQVRARIESDYDRAYQPAGRARQLMAIVCSPDRTPDLSRLRRLPTLVVHGEDDPLVDVSGGRATADAVHGAELLIVPGMGHDLPEAVYDRVVDAVATLAGIG
ncbi:MAG: alpha/beta fold hydrolase [Acidimicrobiales bacterium]